MNEGHKRLTVVLGGLSVVIWIIFLASVTDGFASSRLEVDQAIYFIVFGGAVAYAIPWGFAKLFFWVWSGFKKPH